MPQGRRAGSGWGARPRRRTGAPGTTRIACTRSTGAEGEQIYTLRPDGTDLRQLTGGAGQGGNWGPAWRPDGARICFTSSRAGYAGLWLMAPDGSDQQMLTGAAGAEDCDPTWSPDGAAIVFARGDHRADELWLLDLPSGRTRRLTCGPWLDSSPAWSPDGRWIVFHRALSSPPGLHIIPAAGSEARFLAPGTHPSWAPDGARLAWAHGASLWLLNMRADGTATGRATPLVCSAEMLVARSSWSPDGDALVFEARLMDAGGVRERLMVVDRDGGEPRELGPGCQPIWSPHLSG